MEMSKRLIGVDLAASMNASYPSFVKFLAVQVTNFQGSKLSNFIIRFHGFLDFHPASRPRKVLGSLLGQLRWNGVLQSSAIGPRDTDPDSRSADSGSTHMRHVGVLQRTRDRQVGHPTRGPIKEAKYLAPSSPIRLYLTMKRLFCFLLMFFEEKCFSFGSYPSSIETPSMRIKNHQGSLRVQGARQIQTAQKRRCDIEHLLRRRVHSLPSPRLTV